MMRAMTRNAMTPYDNGTGGNGSGGNGSDRNGSDRNAANKAAKPADERHRAARPTRD